MNKEFNIIQYDDKIEYHDFSVEHIKPALIENFHIKDSDIHIYPEHSLDNLKNKIISENKIDLLILDIIQENPDGSKTEVAYEILNNPIIRQKIISNRVPIIIYSIYDDKAIDINRFIGEDNIKFEIIRKQWKVEPRFPALVLSVLKKLIPNSLNNEFEFQYSRDNQTLSSIYFLGKDTITAIFAKFLEKQGIVLNDKNIIVEAITPGLSGAQILKVSYDDSNILLKISNNKLSIQNEFRNLKSFYKDLRSIVSIRFTDINPEELSSNGYYGIIYELIEKSQTLFSLLLNETVSKKEIETYLSKIFSEVCLQKFYSKTKIEYKTINQIIFNSFDPFRVNMVINSVENLENILKQYSHNYSLDISLITSIVKLHSFSKICDEKLKNTKNNIVFSHGDLHSNNILIDKINNQSILIDPGNCDYMHWSLDISRLIVDLLLRGIDLNSIKYFELSPINTWLIDVEKIITEKNPQLSSSEEYNNRLFTAINWLRSNLPIIHKNRYTEMEFQLGLASEFLRASYKTISLPPGKRVLALLSACKAVSIANDNFII